MAGSKTTREDESKFDAAKAELFEAVGHPNRIKIIQALDQESMGFAELKKKVGMESSGHLSFHLGKLEHLVALNADGQYALTGEGREALRMIHTVKEGGGSRTLWKHLPTGRSLVAILVVLLVALATVAAVQQVEIANLSARPPGTVSLDGQRFWYAVIPLGSIPSDRNVSFVFNGVNFTLMPTSLVSLATLTVRLNSTISSCCYFTSNGTSGVVQVTPPTVFTLLSYPNVQVRFSDGKSETMSVEHTISQGNVITFSYAPPAYPWFSIHQSPRVAISENGTAVTLYVSG